MIDFSVYGEQTPHIHGFRCLKCGAIFYPAPMICGKCDSKRDPVTGKGWEEFDLEGPCTLLTWTRVCGTSPRASTRNSSCSEW
jgi:uncharacterized OB-fold protein